MHPLARLDRQYVWHPFTQMRDWMRQEPLVLVRGRGAVLEDAYGRGYLDANSSIWTNLQGHGHPKLDRALKLQLGKVAHTSALGFANEPASILARQLVKAAPRSHSRSKAGLGLSKVFFSDDGSTAVEVGLKMAYEFARRTLGHSKPRFLSLEGAYHGDTIGAVSLGHIDLFHRAYHGLLFRTDSVMSPYCYRCPYNRAKPDRADARSYRKCNWECVSKVEQKVTRAKHSKRPYSAMVIEPLIQGAAGMIPQPTGWLKRVDEILRGQGVQWIADEVMTGLGRTGHGTHPGRRPLPLFACQHEGVVPDYLALAKGLSGGYLPLAATLTHDAVFGAFLGEYREFKTFFHGHSFTANPLGCAVGIENLALLESRSNAELRVELEENFNEALGSLWQFPAVGDIRRVGLIAGIELVRNWRTREAFELRDQVGIRVCEAMARRGVLTRPVGNVLVLMPPYCTTKKQIRLMVEAMGDAIEETVQVTK